MKVICTRAILNKVAVGIAALFCAMAIFFTANAAEAAIGFKIENVECKVGEIKILGYFYNTDKTWGATVTKVRFVGNVGKYIIDDTFAPLNIQMKKGTIFSRKTFTIKDRKYTSFSANDGDWHLRSTVTIQ